MLDRFDCDVLNLVQRDDSRTGESLAKEIPLSPSALARRLRRLRQDGWIARTIALLSPRLTRSRLRVMVLMRFHDVPGRLALEKQLASLAQVQFCYEIAGPHDLVAMFDCASIAEFSAIEHELFDSSPAVLRWESLFVKHEIKFAPFVELRQPA
jgi:Lrp/AsnC family transcriptional regulator, leucine-responsive regulatory protein